MPKMKTHSGAKKRFRITGKGKVMREQAGRATCSSTSRSRRRVASRTTSCCPPADTKKIKKLLGR